MRVQKKSCSLRINQPTVGGNATTICELAHACTGECENCGAAVAMIHRKPNFSFSDAVINFRTPCPNFASKRMQLVHQFPRGRGLLCRSCFRQCTMKQPKLWAQQPLQMPIKLTCKACIGGKWKWSPWAVATVASCRQLLSGARSGPRLDSGQSASAGCANSKSESLWRT